MIETRRLPKESRFATVEELFALSTEDRGRCWVWLGPRKVGGHGYKGNEWMRADSLLDPTGFDGGRASLGHAPSSMVVVIYLYTDDD